MAVRAFTLLPARRLLSYKQFLRSLAFGPHPTLRNAFTHFPTTDTCPDPTCACSSTPTDLDINYKLPLAGTKPPYAQHIVVCTGHEDWSSRIEDDAGPNLAKELKALLGPKGRFHNVGCLPLASTCTKKSVSESDSSYVSLAQPPRFHHERELPHKCAEQPRQCVSISISFLPIHPTHRPLYRWVGALRPVDSAQSPNTIHPTLPFSAACYTRNYLTCDPHLRPRRARPTLWRHGPTTPDRVSTCH